MSKALNLFKELLGMKVESTSQPAKSSNNRTKSVQSQAPFQNIHQFMRMKDGGMRIFTSISPINPENLNDIEFENVIEIFKEIFDSNPGTIQMKASSEPLNIEKHLSFIAEKKDAATSGHNLTRISNYERYVLQKKRYSKSQKVFYITILSHAEDDDEAEKELRFTVESISEKIKMKDMEITILTDDQLRRVMYQKMSPYTSTTQPYSSDMKDEECFPPYMLDKTHYLEVDRTYFRQYFITRYPAGKNKPGWFNQILNKDNVDLDIFAVPMESEALGTNVSNAIKRLEDRLSQTRSKDETIRISNQIKSQEELLQEIQDNQAYNVGVVVTVYHADFEQMEKQSRLVEKAIKSGGMKPMVLGERGFQPFYYYVPICYVDDLLKKFSQPMHSLTLSSMFPFQASEINSVRGVVTGYNPLNDSLIIIDRYDREKYNNGNGVTFGGSGAGKTAAKMSEIDRLIELNEVNRIVVIDPEAEYDLPSANRHKFEIGGKFCTNPFHIRSIVLDDENDSKDGVQHAGKKMLQQTADITSWLKWIYPEISREESAIASRLIRQCYAQRGIVESTESIRDDYEEPTLETFAKVAKEEGTLEKLVHILDPFVYGQYKSLFCGPTNWDMNNKLTVLDLNHLEEGMQSPLYDLLMKDIWAEFKKNRNERTGLYCDEAHRMLNPNNLQTLIFIVHAFKQFRKYGSFIEIMTQQVGDIIAMGIQYAQQILANATFKNYLYMDSEWENLLKIQKLSEKELHVITNKTQKGRGILIAGKTRTMFQSEPTLDQWKFIDPKLYEKSKELVVG